jgi:hypothetical protein
MKTFIGLLANARFNLGQIVTTPGAMDACSPDHLAKCLARHAQGDWGVICAEDAASNDEALKDGSRVLSAYPIDPAKPCKGLWRQHALDHHRGRPQRDHVFVARRILTRPGSRLRAPGVRVQIPPPAIALISVRATMCQNVAPLPIGSIVRLRCQERRNR